MGAEGSRGVLRTEGVLTDDRHVLQASVCFPRSPGPRGALTSSACCLLLDFDSGSVQ